MASDDESSHFTEEPLRLVKFISPEDRAKKVMMDVILLINNLYYIRCSTLYLALQNTSRYLEYVAARLDFSAFTEANYEELKIAALIILNLSSKFLDRISYSISDLLKKTGF